MIVALISFEGFDAILLSDSMSVEIDAQLDALYGNLSEALLRWVGRQGSAGQRYCCLLVRRIVGLERELYHDRLPVDIKLEQLGSQRWKRRR